jgi:hypothetical protein
MVTFKSRTGKEVIVVLLMLLLVLLLLLVEASVVWPLLLLPWIVWRSLESSMDRVFSSGSVMSQLRRLARGP